VAGGSKVWGRDRLQFALVEELPAIHPAWIHAAAGVVKFDAFEWAIEGHGAGMSTIVPLAAERSEKACSQRSETRGALEEDPAGSIAAIPARPRAVLGDW